MSKNFHDIDDFEIYLDSEIDYIMGGEIAEEVKEIIKISEKKLVYSYPAKYKDRRILSGGGISDVENMKADYDNPTQILTITVDAPWQQRLGGTEPSNSLTDVIENNRMYGAPKRPFAKDAEENAQEWVEQQLVRILHRDGL